MQLRSSVLAFLCGLVLLTSPINGIEKPSEMSTDQILNELKSNNQEMMNSSDKIWSISKESREESEKSREELEKSKEALEELRGINEQLEMNQYEQESLVTAMTDFSMSLNEDLAKERKRNRNKNIVIWSLVGTTALASVIAILK